MADIRNLTTTTNGSLQTETGGTQSAAQSPQTASSTNSTFTNAAQGTEVQPGTTSSDILTNVGGIPLSTTNVTAVPLSTSTGSTQAIQPVHHHKANPVLLTISILLFLLAIGLFYATSRTAKKTTL